ncbi:MAG TPA: MoaD/ThiS family protein [Dehalococcoidia bacterium]|nr:MoaD/ThiS family protein [Dehalococcoidia bacterium]
MEWQPGMRVIDLLHREGWQGDDAAAIAAIVNGEQAAAERELHDGDQVELMVAIAGG